ncbi:CDP-glycerol glycerophosphotransferase family protein [Neisseria meningitidis]|uniref:CapZC n=1 Tax=Neisseria meningitidis TaxID=487 RepID=Q5QRV6_NEIME|nr:CDP-glycerol glycerophosphotransferase family protein [Neisseria meningitidis]AEQ62085.1 CapZC [Neisseria meningitidis]CAG30793.1 CapZC protein [Neisseria meningitidis]CCP19920.1 teichoic acid synthase [Neisseria meningitidis]
MKNKINKTLYLLSTPLVYWQGIVHYQKKQWAKAEPYFKRAVVAQPDHAYSNFKLGMCFFKRRIWEQAYQYISTAVSLKPEVLSWHVQLRQSEAHLRRQSRFVLTQTASLEGFNKSTLSAAEIEEQVLMKQLERNVDNPEFYAQLAQLHGKHNKLWQALDFWKEALTRQQTNADWFYQSGAIYEKLQHYIPAAEAYNRAIALMPKGKVPADWYYRLGFVYEQQGHDNQPDFQKASQAYEEAIAADKKLQAKKFGIGVFHAARRYWKEAIAAYEKTSQISPSAELFYRLGFIYDRNYQWPQAEERYQTALALDNRPEWRFRLGLAQEKQEKFAEAAASYQKAAQERKQYTPYWFYRAAYSLEKSGSYQEAAQWYLRIRKDSTLVSTQKVSDVQSSHNAIFALEVRHRYDMSEAGSWYELGTHYENLQDWPKAQDAYSQAVARSNSLNSLWYYRLGFVLMQQGLFAQACASFRNYRAMQRPHGTSEEILSTDANYAEAAIYSEYYSVLNVIDKTIVYESFAGQSMSCSPYALFLYMFNHPDYQDWTHIWVINDPAKIPEEYKCYKNVIFVARGSDVYLRYLATAKVLLNNSNFPPCFIRKPEQKYLSAWHGTPFKTLGRDMEGRFFEHKNLTRNIFQATHLLSPNPHTSHVLYKRHDIHEIYTGKLIEAGYPRIDLTLVQTSEEKAYLRERLGLTDQEKLIFYAPTWRGTHDNIDFDYEKLQQDFDRLGRLKGAKLVFRGHALLQAALADMDLNVTVAPDDLDTNRILGVTDILITDYSSTLFDYLPVLKPLVLYMYDIEEYTAERGLYFSAGELPGHKCYNSNELIQTLQDILDQGVPSVTAEEHQLSRFAPYDDGHVSERVMNAILYDDYQGIKVINDVPKDKQSLLIYGGPFMGNGITTATINLIANIDRSKYTVTLVIDPGSIINDETRMTQFEKLPQDINVIARVGRMDMTLEDRYIHGLMNQRYELDSPAAKKILKDSWKQEYDRVFGQAKFDALIHFEGYNRFWAGVFTSVNDGRKTSIYMHSSMKEEYQLKFPYLKAMFGYGAQANKYISVSKSTMQRNQSNLAQPFNIPLEKFDYTDNLQQPEQTRILAAEPLLPEDEQYFQGTGKVFITIGRLSMEKDHAKLINSFAQIAADYPDSRLLIVGDGALRHALSQQIAELKLENQVHLLGLRSNPFPLLKKADCFVLSSNHEGQPMTLFEAMILEKMIIATDIVGSRGVLENRSGYLVENSVAGLAQGLADFLAGKLTLTTYDIEEYQQQAINRFYHLIN